MMEEQPKSYDAKYYFKLFKKMCPYHNGSCDLDCSIFFNNYNRIKKNRHSIYNGFVSQLKFDKQNRPIVPNYVREVIPQPEFDRKLWERTESGMAVDKYMMDDHEMSTYGVSRTNPLTLNSINNRGKDSLGNDVWFMKKLSDREMNEWKKFDQLNNSDW